MMTKQFNRREWLQASAGLAAGLPGAKAVAQTAWPTKPLRLVVPLSLIHI